MAWSRITDDPRPEVDLRELATWVASPHKDELERLAIECEQANIKAFGSGGDIQIQYEDLYYKVFSRHARENKWALYWMLVEDVV